MSARTSELADVHVEHMDLPATSPGKGSREWEAGRQEGAGSLINGRLLTALPVLVLMTLVVNGATVAGTARTLDGTCHIRSAGVGLYAISEVEESPLNCGVEEPHSETDHQH